jgi:hypothetical protein
LKIQTNEGSAVASPPANYLTAINSLDNCFIIPKIEKTVSSGEVLIQKTGHTKYINLGNNRLKAIFEFGLAWEENRVVFFGMPIAYKSKSDNIPIPFSFDDNLWPFSSFYEFAAEFLKGMKVAKHELNLTGGNKKVVRLVEELFTDYWQSNEHDVISIAISRTEFQNILTEITNNNLDQDIHPVFLNYDLTTGIDSNSVDYSKADLKLVGFENDGTTISKLHVNPSAANLANVYAVDLFTFSTDDAAHEEGVAVSTFSEFLEGNYQEIITTTLSNQLTSGGKGNIFGNLNQSGIYNDLLERMLKMAKSLKIKFDSTVTWAKAGDNAKAKTFYPGTKFKGSALPSDTVVIIFLESYIQNTSEISFVRTLIHELMHAYVDFLLYRENAIFRHDTSTTSPRDYIIIGIEDLDGIYDFYCRFGTRDGGVDYPERSYGHNYMAAIQRNKIVDALKEYDVITNINRSSGTVLLEDLFNSNSNTTFSFNTDDFYQALAWGGLQLTRSWREFAIKDQLKMQAYVAIVYNENNGESYSTLYETSKFWDANHFGYATSSNRKPQNCP